jgi:hypothetical protein
MNESQSILCMHWLAKFHALNWGREKAEKTVAEDGLQRQGGYWYLDTRPDEHSAMPHSGMEGRLRLAARAIDARLKEDTYQTIIHGDAKGANIVFHNGVVGFYDFQYCGLASPAKDLAYFLACATDVPEAEGRLLQVYCDELIDLLGSNSAPTPKHLQDSLALAYCDLGRWMSGWGWWGNDIQDKIEEVLVRLDGGKALACEDAYCKAIRREFPVPSLGF